MTTNTMSPVESATETATATVKPARRKTKPSRSAADTGKAKQPGRPGAKRQTKQSRLADMLRRKGGATIAQIMKAFGWQPHTARAAISGLKKRDERVESAIENGSRVYRIASEKAPS